MFKQHASFRFGTYKPRKKFNEMFHGCGLAYKDGKRPLVLKGQTCKFATANPFWKAPEHVKLKKRTIKTIEEEKQLASKRYVKVYFQSINKFTNTL